MKHLLKEITSCEKINERQEAETKELKKESIKMYNEFKENPFLNADLKKNQDKP